MSVVCCVDAGRDPAHLTDCRPFLNGLYFKRAKKSRARAAGQLELPAKIQLESNKQLLSPAGMRAVSFTFLAFSRPSSADVEVSGHSGKLW